MVNCKFTLKMTKIVSYSFDSSIVYLTFVILLDNFEPIMDMIKMIVQEIAVCTDFGLCSKTVV